MDELTEANKALLREEQSKLIEVIEAYVGLEKVEEWQVLNKLVFAPAQEVIKRQIVSEVLKPTIDLNKLYKLQGEFANTLVLCDPKRTIDQLKQRLENIKNKLK